MSGKHEHTHVHCQHERIAYCARCAVVHCKDCGREWQDNPPTWYPWYYNYGTNAYPNVTPTITCGDGPITGTTSAYNSANITLTGGCPHRG